MKISFTNIFPWNSKTNNFRIHTICNNRTLIELKSINIYFGYKKSLAPSIAEMSKCKKVFVQRHHTH